MIRWSSPVDWLDLVRWAAAVITGAFAIAGYGSAQEPPFSTSDNVSVFQSNRPEAVPLEYVETPSGYFHPSCVIAVREDEFVRGDVIERADGAKRHIPRCDHPHYDRRGNAIFSGRIPPEVDGWVAEAEDVTAPVEWLSATWTVPAAPTSNVGQTVYLFPGLEHTPGAEFIVQPVLAWNGLHAPAGWAIYNWNCCRNGVQLYSPAVAVSTGEAISGYAWGTNCDAATGVCGAWQVRTSSTNSSSTLNTDAYGQNLNWIFGGVLEAYNVTQCNQYPASGNVAYQNVTANSVGGVNIPPTWTPVVFSGLTPSCNYAVQANGANVTIQWSCTPVTKAQACGTSICGTQPDGCGGTISCGTCGANQYCGSYGYCYCSYPYRNCGNPPPSRPQCYKICP